MFKIWILSSLFILTVILVFLPANLQPTTRPVLTVKDVPELGEILSSNQETRLKAARRLVERVDVTNALEILNNSPLPHTGEGHLVVHQVGFYAYKKYGPASILYCKDYFLYACYHGAIIEAASNSGFGAISQMANHCKSSQARYFQCAHASGHAILAIWDYNLPEALKTCDQIFEKEAEFAESLSSCHNGAFMENLFGVHDFGVREIPKRDWLKDSDPFSPCNFFGEKYQKGCWLNQAARIYQLYNGDIVKTAKTCQSAGNQKYTEWCLDNLARQIHALTNGEISKVFSLCQMLGENFRENCIIVNAGSYYSVGDPATAIGICSQIIPPAKGSCYQGIISQITSDNLTQTEKKKLCKKIGGEFEKSCLWQIKI